MRQTTSKQLYAYWDRVRNGRLAPRRLEIEPAHITPLLPETFIAEYDGRLSYRFRLAGTRICEHFGKELRGSDLLGLWAPQDRHVLASLLRHVVRDAAVGIVLFNAYDEDERRASFELLVMPLIHADGSISRLLGAISAIEPPFWLGAQTLTMIEVVDVRPIAPDAERTVKPISASQAPAASPSADNPRKRFRVYPGGAN